MKNSMVSNKKRTIFEGKVLYSLFSCEGEFSLLTKEEKQGELVLNHEVSFPCSSEKQALSFAENLIESAVSPLVIEELIEDYFE